MPISENPVITSDKTALGCTNQQLRQLMRRMSQRYDHEIGKAGLLGTQYSLLSHVVKLGPIRPGDLAQTMQMDPSTLSRNLRPMIASGWLSLQEGTDARSRLITATPAGRAKRLEARRYWQLAQDGINKTLGMKRVVALHALIQESLQLMSEKRDNDEEFR